MAVVEVPWLGRACVAGRQDRRLSAGRWHARAQFDVPPPAARLQRNLLQHLQLSLDANIEDAVKGDRPTRKIVRVARNEARREGLPTQAPSREGVAEIHIAHVHGWRGGIAVPLPEQRVGEVLLEPRPRPRMPAEGALWVPADAWDLLPDDVAGSMAPARERAEACARAISRDRMAPPAGPDSTSRIGKRAAVSSVVRPPPEVIIRNGQSRPMACSSPARRSR